ncbi:hypothetical protein ACFC1R_37615 [Kitasatospora sp. NPDC056138]|uniref:hypothetical protein n=1 Tax=Kitasatospora sp. NPDC056138 TaxID=3345724 RepID=UPI0035D66C46
MPVDRHDQVEEVPAIVDLAAVAEIVAAYRGRVLLAADRDAADAIDETVADGSPLSLTRSRLCPRLGPCLTAT